MPGLQAVLLQHLRQIKQCLRQYLSSEGWGQCPKQSTEPSASPRILVLLQGAQEQLGSASQEKALQGVAVFNLPLQD